MSAEKLPKTIEDKLKKLFEGSSPDAEDLEPLLCDIAATCGLIIFAIDGFDECSKADRVIVLRMLHRFMSSSRSIIKVFFSSREDLVGEIGRVFKTYQQVTMDCEEARKDILTYVNDIIAEKTENGDLVVGNIQLLQDIHDALVRGANGM